MVLLPHVVDLHPCELSKTQRFLNRKTRIIRVNMNFHYLVVRHTDNRITDGFQIRFKLLLLLIGELSSGKDDKLRTVAELNVGLLHRCLPKGCLWLLGWFDRRIIDLLPKKRIIRTS